MEEHHTPTFNSEQMTKVNDLIANRRSKRAFDPSKPIETETVTCLFEAARWAPSAFNEQPWRFIYAHKNTPGFEDLLNLLLPNNQIWAQHAGMLMLVLAKKTNSYNGEYNRHHLHDVGLAMGMLSVQATELGLNLHQMGGFKIQEALDFYNVPQDFEAVTITAIGYLGSEAILSEPFLQREKQQPTRKDISEFAFENNWK